MIETQLTQVIQNAVAALGYEVWGIEQSDSGRDGQFIIYIDAPNGVTIDDCAQATRQITAQIAVDAPDFQNAELEVSSPGIERRLFTLDQYQRYIGEVISLKLYFPKENRRRFKGQLISANDSEVIIKIGHENWHFSHADIHRAHLSPEF